MSVMKAMTSGALGTIPKIAANPKQRIDNAIFKLHYRFTFWFLLAASILVSLNDLIGAPIECMTGKGPGKEEQFQKAINQYCWISSTFTLPHLLDKEIGSEVPHPGLGPHTDAHEKKYHAYYQWVAFALFFQACMFYFPHWVWNKFCEQKLLSTIVMGMDSPLVDIKKPHFGKGDKKDPRSKAEILVQYIAEHIGKHQLFFFTFAFCEILNLVNVAVQTKMTDAFLGNQFTDLGFQVMSYANLDPENRTDPLYVVFPRVTKCTWHMYGRSGTVETYDAICVLALNIINEKIYIFLWFWLVLLCLLSVGQVLYRLATIVLLRLRQYELRLGSVSRTKTDNIADTVSSGDWFLLMHLRKHIDPIHYSKIIEQLGDELRLRGGQRGGEMRRLSEEDSPPLTPTKAPLLAAPPQPRPRSGKGEQGFFKRFLSKS